MKKILITGSSGLVGSELVAFFAQRGWMVYGLDNNMRAEFFGPQGDTKSVREYLEKTIPNFSFLEGDVRDRKKVIEWIASICPEAVVHAAAQPSHDLASRRPFDDFDVNALGTLNLLEACRRAVPESSFVFLSTNKVYGDGPNRLPLVELETRFDFQHSEDIFGISERMSVDSVTHSLFGASKLAADILVQEYGRYFGMPSCCLRCGCVTGPRHKGVELHGFLNYLIKCNVYRVPYTIYGYKGKQVRDNIHAWDVASFIEQFIEKPKISAVYNMGGGRPNSISILEAFDRIEKLSGIKMISDYVDTARKGDHKCYISDLRKIQVDYPGWTVTKDLDVIFEDIYRFYQHQVDPI